MFRLRLSLLCSVALVVAAVVAPRAGADEPAPGERFALLIGVKSYDPKELKNLQFSDNDVTALADILRQGGYRRENVRLMTAATSKDNPNWFPSARNIHKELKLLLDDRRTGDTVLVAFAGHGVQFKGSDESFFCPADAQVSDKQNLLSITELYKELEKCKAGFKLLLVDACRNDPVADVTRDAGVQVESVTRPQKKDPPGGVAALFSCSAGEKAFEDKELRHGVFFHFVIEGLRGQAAPPQGKEVTLNLLADFVQQRVSGHVRDRFSARQMPEQRGEIRGRVALVRLDTVPDGPSAALTDSRLKEGNALKQKGDMRAATASYSRVIDANPRFAEAYLQRGSAWQRMGQLDRAKADYDQALRINPRLWHAYISRGRTSLWQGDFEKAVADHARAIEVNPRSPEAYRSRGEVYHDKGLYDKALADYEKALSLKPTYAPGYAYRANTLVALGKFDQAISDANKALALDSKLAVGYFSRGCAYQGRKQLERAVDDYSRAIALNPEYVEAYENRGDTYLKMGMVLQAPRDYLKAIELDGLGNPKAVERLQMKLKRNRLPLPIKLFPSRNR